MSSSKFQSLQRVSRFHVARFSTRGFNDLVHPSSRILRLKERSSDINPVNKHASCQARGIACFFESIFVHAPRSLTTTLPSLSAIERSNCTKRTTVIRRADHSAIRAIFLDGTFNANYGATRANRRRRLNIRGAAYKNLRYPEKSARARK